MRIAGGMFGIEENLDQCREVEPQFMRPQKTLFLSARCAFRSLLHTLKPPQVWMPSYICDTMIHAIDPRATTLKFYPIAHDLRIEAFDWLDNLLPESLVIFVDYFGFPYDDRAVKQVHAKGCYVLEDACQALLSSHVGRHSDFVVFSPRKTVGVPDGGVLQFLNGTGFAQEGLLPPPRQWWMMALEACVARREFDIFGGERKWFELFRTVEATYPLGPFRMSELSETLLYTAFDYEAIARIRRANYKRLAESLGEYALLKSLDEESVPLGFPIVVENRDYVRKYLFANQIYPPVHWDIGGVVPPSFRASHELSRRIMTIPCDQRLNDDDMLRIRNVIHNALAY